MRSYLAAFLLWNVAFAAHAQEVVAVEQAEGAAPEQEAAAPENAVDERPEEDGLDDAGRLVYEAAVAAFEAGRFDEALERFQTAHRLSGRDRLYYNIALCFDRLDRKAEALEHYELFLGAAGDDAMGPRARERVEVLGPAVEEERVAEERNQPEEITPLPAQRNLAGPIALLGVGAAGLITWATAGLIARSRYNDAEATCGASCDDDTRSGITTPALVADIGLGVGIAAAAGGLVWVLVGGASDASEAGVRIAPMSGGLSAHGRF